MYVTAAHVCAQQGVVSVLQECTRLHWDPSQRPFGLLQLDRDEEKSLTSRPARELDSPLTVASTVQTSSDGTTPSRARCGLSRAGNTRPLEYVKLDVA